ncbi:substrate-binding periplasmic protein [Roseateles toxinivorans]|uniref:Amino acid ABC transporter substrate-binding protein (PAAT family) n=1 Tax=Roseateles toxinivorans TaxID=270368 RepID=A0A4R6QHL0_9BURK|nr:transporter substrate-binding domain-containing protein [Roseateles toxinivorans]TDP62137.1 amino acid ABC transporter substrate-binding protein (PAAT family) [Roseateles toxinivorans]
MIRLIRRFTPSLPLHALLAWLAQLSLALHCVGASALTIGSPDNSEVAQMAQAVLRQAYAKAGIAFRPTSLPLRRSLQMADRGETDGEMMRSAGTLQTMPQLIRIDVPVARLVLTVYRRGECPRSTSVAELSQQRVAYFRGTLLIERLLPAGALIPADDTWDALRRLQAGMADAAIGAELETDTLLASNGVRGICKVTEPVSDAPLYHALHERHAALAARLEQVLKEMQASGELVRIWAAEEKRLRDEAARRARLPR